MPAVRSAMLWALAGGDAKPIAVSAIVATTTTSRRVRADPCVGESEGMVRSLTERRGDGPTFSEAGRHASGGGVVPSGGARLPRPA